MHVIVTLSDLIALYMLICDKKNDVDGNLLDKCTDFEESEE